MFFWVFFICLFVLVVFFFFVFFFLYKTSCFMKKKKANYITETTKGPDQPVHLSATDKRMYGGNIFLISPWKHMLWVLITLEVPCQGTSNEYHNICFCEDIRKILSIFAWKNVLSEIMICTDWSKLSMSVNKNFGFLDNADARRPRLDQADARSDQEFVVCMTKWPFSSVMTNIKSCRHFSRPKVSDISIISPQRHTLQVVTRSMSLRCL